MPPLLVFSGEAYRAALAPSRVVAITEEMALGTCRVHLTSGVPVQVDGDLDEVLRRIEDAMAST